MRLPFSYSFVELLLFGYCKPNPKQLQQLKGQTILITGASYGIGEALVRELAHVQVELILVARTAEKLEQLKLELANAPAHIQVYPCDLSQTTAVEKLLAQLQNHHPNIHVVVNNAGKSIRRPLMQSLDRYHDFTRTMNLNYLAPVQLLLGLIPTLQRSKGHIINVSAVNVLLTPAPYWAAYQASKTAFDQWLRSASPELEANGVACSHIYLPLVRTRMIEPTAAYKNMPAMHVEHVACLLAKTMTNRRRIYRPWWLIFGQLASVLFRRLGEFAMTRQTNKKQ